jgi:hypothetical protein
MFKQYLDANGYQNYAAYNSHFILKELPEFVAETKTCKRQKERDHADYNYWSCYGYSQQRKTQPDSQRVNAGRNRKN